MGMPVSMAVADITVEAASTEAVDSMVVVAVSTAAGIGNASSPQANDGRQS
jgi:hypothetical protein